MSPLGLIDNAMVKAIARAFRWRDMLETDQYATISEIAKAERINESYVARVLRLTLLAPVLIEALLAGRSCDAHLQDLLKRFPVEWHAQQHERLRSIAP
jgi:hypothetical protein